MRCGWRGHSVTGNIDAIIILPNAKLRQPRWVDVGRSAALESVHVIDGRHSRRYQSSHEVLLYSFAFPRHSVCVKWEVHWRSTRLQTILYKFWMAKVGTICSRAHCSAAGHIHTCNSVAAIARLPPHLNYFVPIRYVSAPLRRQHGVYQCLVSRYDCVACIKVNDAPHVIRL